MPKMSDVSETGGTISTRNTIVDDHRSPKVSSNETHVILSDPETWTLLTVYREGKEESRWSDVLSFVGPLEWSSPKTPEVQGGDEAAL